MKVRFGRRRNRKRNNNSTLTLAATTNLVGTEVLKSMSTSTSTTTYTTNTNTSTPTTTAMATTTATTEVAMMTGSTILAVTKTKNAPIEEHSQANNDQQSRRIDNTIQQDELRSSVPTDTVQEQRSYPTSKLDDLLLSLQLDPKIVMALSDTFSKYPTAGNHFYSSLGKRFSNGQHGDVDTVIDTAAVDDAQTTILLQQPLIVVPPPLVTLSRSTRVMTEDIILFDKNAFTIKGSRQGRNCGQPRDSRLGEKNSQKSCRIEIDHGHYQSYTHQSATGSGIANGSGTSDGTTLF